MKNLLLALLGWHILFSLGFVDASVSVLPVVAPTYALASPSIVTAHSHQVVARNFNRFYVPATGVIAAAGYPATTAIYPATATYGYYPHSYYPAYGYNYGYGLYG